MKAIIVSTPGEPSVMDLKEVSAPVPQSQQVVVDVAAAGVNFIDVYHRSGQYPLATPFTMGLEGAGTVARVASDVDDVRVGDRVAWMQGPGSYAEQVAIRADKVVPVPDGVELTTAAAMMLQGVTAHYLTHSTYAIKPDDVVVVHAAAGGVGQLLTQIAKRMGATVLATASTAEKQERARAMGADDVFEYGELERKVAMYTGSHGAHVVYDGVGAATFDSSIAALRPRGMMVLYGQSSGVVPPVDPQTLSRHGSLFLTRPTSVDYVSQRDELLWRTQDLFEWVESEALDVHIGHTYGLSDAARAHTDLQARRTTGKVLLRP